MRGPEPRRIAAKDTADTAKPERSNIFAQQRARLGRIVDKQRKGRAARERFEAERAGAGKEIEHARAGDRVAIGMDKNVEQGLAQLVGSRADRVRARRGERAPAQAATDDAHQPLLRRKRRRRFSRRASSGSPRRSASRRFAFGPFRGLSAPSRGGRPSMDDRRGRTASPFAGRARRILRSSLERTGVRWIGAGASAATRSTTGAAKSTPASATTRSPS